MWGIGQALHKEAHNDPHWGRFINHRFAEYHVASNADIDDIDDIDVCSLPMAPDKVMALEEGEGDAPVRQDH